MSDIKSFILTRSGSIMHTADKINNDFNFILQNNSIEIISIYHSYDNTSRVRTMTVIYKDVTIQKPETLDVPLEQKVYDFVDVEVSDDNINWYPNGKLYAVLPDTYNGSYKYCRFINK